MKETLTVLNYQMLGHNIRIWRIGSGIKRSEFAKRFNITVEDLINYEYAFQPILTALVALICENWKMKLSDLTKHHFDDYPKANELEEDFEIDFADKKGLAAIAEKLNEAVSKCKYVQKLLNETTEENFSLKRELKENKKKIDDLESQISDKGPRIFLASSLSNTDSMNEERF
jgi:transcriptional regulator with XRE-family HTH domain